MIKHLEELRTDSVSNFRGGKGEIQMTHFLETEKDEFKGKGRLFAKNVLKPGTSIGLHEHVGDFETYVVLSGEGMVDDNGEQKSVKPGDVIITKNGEKHSIENTGTVDLEVMALILFD
ncbi:cupin domain-containing protein [Desulfosporosinus meridiei]|uniref:Cupin domain-containing protein n=1 Tax=Desulfosporosinus meridiei (strain ATCC BAA-275 / DSM 13257 / KCTC 12902 / NCIMB 13706 / S10) TaxID=768704 RepID=J7J172_DESMD|nr:cupin domain-containing protein [Desulfosporosinus meridiei]AFQ45063.1 cupin domain-containing protein [Desulfosporosinus meridiei DSM 13257]